ncbi:MAG: hypothetical protein JNK79_10605 [Chitinophagaceae bacterium]|nr:hypothetical protein [Chitinophagaceae bacterium]
MKAFYAVPVLVLFLWSCKKEKASKTKTELLTTGSWHVTNYIVDPGIDWDGDGTEETNVYPVMEPCIKDDFSTFHADGTGEINEGPTKCVSNGSQTIPFTWAFLEDEKRLQVQGVIYLLDALTETQLVVKEIEVVSTVTYTHTVTFSH